MQKIIGMKRNGNDLDKRWFELKSEGKKHLNRNDDIGSINPKKYVFNANGSESKWNRTMHTTAAIHLVVGFFFMFNLLISFICSFFFSRSLPLCFLSLCPCAQQCHRWIVRHSTKVKCTEQLNWTGESQAGYERTNEQHSITDSAVSLTHSANSHL